MSTTARETLSLLHGIYEVKGINRRDKIANHTLLNRAVKDGVITYQEGMEVCRVIGMPCLTIPTGKLK